MAHGSETSARRLAIGQAMLFVSGGDRLRYIKTGVLEEVEDKPLPYSQQAIEELAKNWSY